MGDVIANIIIGPKAEVFVDDVRNILSSYGLYQNISVKKSIASYI